jgi:transcriptional regulator with XRE-family HTH domain
VPRKNPVPETEQAICARFRTFRKSLDLTAVAFARQLGIDSSRLASYEHGRVPIRFGLAHTAFVKFRLNLRWLAEGKEPKRYLFHIPYKLSDRIDRKALFSEVYRLALKHDFEKHFGEIEQHSGAKDAEAVAAEWGDTFGIPTAGEMDPGLFAELVAQRVQDYAASMPPNLFQTLFSAVSETLRRFAETHRAAIAAFKQIAPSGWGRERYPRPATKEEIAAFEKVETHSSTSEPRRQEPASEIQRIALDSPSENGNNIPVKTEIERLLDKVKRLAAKPGRKAAIAAALGISQSRVSEWLSGVCEPGGQNTLRLLRWVQEQESQQKRSGTASTAPEQRTRRGKPRNAESQSDPSKV